MKRALKILADIFFWASMPTFIVYFLGITLIWFWGYMVSAFYLAGWCGWIALFWSWNKFPELRRKYIPWQVWIGYILGLTCIIAFWMGLFKDNKSSLIWQIFGALYTGGAPILFLLTVLIKLFIVERIQHMARDEKEFTHLM
ncbi:MAG TPA: hypothetical protein VIF82_00270 [Burkholderiaceae bacterium]|jgi:hypothetical protein